MSTPTNRGNTELLECVLLARQVQDQSLALLHGCGEIARRIIAGRVNPNDACALLAEVSESLNSPDELWAFELLAHEQYGHEHLGITAESSAAEIIKECHRLVSLGGGEQFIQAEAASRLGLIQALGPMPKIYRPFAALLPPLLVLPYAITNFLNGDWFGPLAVALLVGPALVVAFLYFVYALVQRLRANNSFKPKPLRGSA